MSVDSDRWIPACAGMTEVAYHHIVSIFNGQGWIADTR